MVKESELIGSFSLYRQEVRPFTDKQIALVTSFANQAVIAIENARLLNELRQRTDDLSQRTTDLSEALDQQTATSEVLQVISSSPGDLLPVFEAENALHICDAKFGNIIAGTVKPSTSWRPTMRHRPMPKREGIRQFPLPIQNRCSAALWQPNR
jgi:hypothetical protein